MRLGLRTCFAGVAALSLICVPVSVGAGPGHHHGKAAAASAVAVGPQYDTTHVYVAPELFDRFVSSLVSTFGGTTSKQGIFQVTPTSSKTLSQLVMTPVGTISVFGFRTPIPYPFGAERTGYLVSDIEAAMIGAKSAGASILVAPFPDPIGRDVVIQWPGGINMQLYWHTQAPAYARLETVPEDRIYISAEAADRFVASWMHFSHGRVLSDEHNADGADVGQPGESFRRIRLLSGFGRLVVLVTNGHVPWPYGREVTGYEVRDLAVTLAKAKAAGASLLVAPYSAGGREAAVLEFPGGYIAEIHAVQMDR